MTGHQIRRSFLKYFEGKGHRILPSSSLVPEKDPTLLFTNAGMVQFKKVFTGEEKIEFKRATTSQKCLRVSGKHNDLENVGRTARHHTFFEMLGNFSFGDYFKQEAIDFSWEFLTDILSLPKEKLWVSVFQDDDEAYDIWKGKDVRPERIVRMGEKENFWAMGETGPCGPCSEIIIDQGEEVGCHRPECAPGCDCDRYLELWNLVFMQYNRQENGKLVPLPKPSIDTGMGLERVAAVLQGVKSNYETDLLRVTIRNTEEITQIKYGEDDEKDISFQVIADHCRGMVFLVGDGILPANEGRGYVLRRIMRRAARHGKKLDLNEPFLYKLSGNVVDQMEEAYPELKERRSYIAMIIQKEEERFLDTLDRGLQILQEEMERLRGSKGQTVPGEVVFKLYDTYGFPLDLTEDIAAEEGFAVDTEGFNQEMEQQRERARMSWKGTGAQEIKGVYSRLSEDGLTVTFLGYDRLKNKSKVERIIRNDEFVESVKPGDEVEIITRETCFYGEAGGQMGDQGVIQGRGSEFQVMDTIRPLPSLILHRGRVRKGQISVGDEVTMKVDENWRQSTVLHHTATHILQSALRQVLGDHVKQSGSLVAPDRLRFDFTHFSPVEERELKRVEELVNQRIRENHPVATKTTSYNEAIKGGAIALFGEKYEDNVRLVKVGKVSSELCGGTHARRSGDIGLFKIVSESGV
ncbi:MAG: alanine--tRNA ligase, partial [Deltaproteobacteria bacterium]